MKTKHQNIICQLSGSPLIEILNYKSDYVGIKTAKSNGFYYIGDDLYITYEGGSVGKKIGTECKLMVHNLSDLTKEIEVDGKKFIPILKLAEVSDNYYKWEFLENRSEFHTAVYYKSENGTRSFSVNVHRNKIYSFTTSMNGMHVQTNSPIEILQALIEWGFDISGLNEKGFAIYINTLK